MKTKITIVNIDGRTDLHVGYHVPKHLFGTIKPTLLTTFEVDDVYISIKNNDIERNTTWQTNIQ